MRGSNGSFVDLGSSPQPLLIHHLPSSLLSLQPADQHSCNKHTMAVEVWRQSQLSSGGNRTPTKWSPQSMAHYLVTLSGEWEPGCDVLAPAFNGAVTALTL